MLESKLLSINDIYAKYGDVEVLRNINVHVNVGEVVTILGANGAGKTTLLRILSGLLQPTSGTIQFNGENIHRRPAYKMRKMGLIQVPEGRGILGSMTVRENPGLARAIHLRNNIGVASATLVCKIIITSETVSEST